MRARTWKIIRRGARALPCTRCEHRKTSAGRQTRSVINGKVEAGSVVFVTRVSVTHIDRLLNDNISYDKKKLSKSVEFFSLEDLLKHETSIPTSFRVYNISRICACKVSSHMNSSPRKLIINRPTNILFVAERI